MKKVEPSQYIKPSLFMSWDEGENRIRVLDGIYEYRKWGTKVGGRYISQIVFDETAPVDPVFTHPDKEGKIPQSKRCWGFVIYSHKAKEFRVLESGPRLGHPLAELLKKDNEFTKHDIIVTKKSGQYTKDNQYFVKYAVKDEPMAERTPAAEAEYRYCQRYFEEKKNGR
jgi:hypothetical protein